MPSPQVSESKTLILSTADKPNAAGSLRYLSENEARQSRHKVLEFTQSSNICQKQRAKHLLSAEIQVECSTDSKGACRHPWLSLEEIGSPEQAYRYNCSLMNPFYK